MRLNHEESVFPAADGQASGGVPSAGAPVRLLPIGFCSVLATSVERRLPSDAFNFNCLQFVSSSPAPSSFRRFFKTAQSVLACLGADMSARRRYRQWRSTLLLPLHSMRYGWGDLQKAGDSPDLALVFLPIGIHFNNANASS